MSSGVSPDNIPITKLRAGLASPAGLASATTLAAALALAGLAWSGGTTAAPVPVIMGATGVSLPSFANIVDRVLPAVVSLSAKVSSGEGKGGVSQGSGFIIDPTGDIVTNNHVIANSSEIEVSFTDGTKYKAKLVGRDEATDIALLKIEAGRPLPSVKLADDRGARVGDWVLAVGNPLGLGGTVTAGILSARDRDQFPGAQSFTDYLQVDAAINPGNSGGPTFDLSGRVIGINTMGRASPWGGAAGGIGFAIPSSTVERVVKFLKEGHAVDRGFVGVQVESLGDDTAQALGLANANGALVTGVVDGSPAEKAGIKRGDVILKINGQLVKDNRELLRKIAALEPGQTATFTIWRDNKQITLTVTVAKRERIAANDTQSGPEGGVTPDVKFTSLGFALQTITPEVRSAYSLSVDAAGVLITQIDLASDAGQRGLRPGDCIIAVGSDDVKSLGDVNLAIEQAKSLKRPSVLLFVVTKRGDKAHVTVKLNKS